MITALWGVLLSLSLSGNQTQTPVQEKLAVSAGTGRVVISGDVRDALGRPVSGATVLLTDQRLKVATTFTQASGTFTLPSVTKGNYVLSVQASGGSSKPAAVPSTSADAVTYHLTLLPPSGRNLSDKEMSFSDQPDFVVSGVTDWTAVGGHGSDVTLRTSEALARTASTLPNASANPGAGSGSSEEELKSALAASPSSADANRALGEYYLCQNRYPQALASLRTALVNNKASAATEYDLAEAFFHLNDLRQAKAHIEHGLVLNDTPEYHRWRVRLRNNPATPTQRSTYGAGHRDGTA